MLTQEPAENCTAAHIVPFSRPDVSLPRGKNVGRSTRSCGEGKPGKPGLTIALLPRPAHPFVSPLASSCSRPVPPFMPLFPPSRYTSPLLIPLFYLTHLPDTSGAGNNVLLTHIYAQVLEKPRFLVDLSARSAGDPRNKDLPLDRCEWSLCFRRYVLGEDCPLAVLVSSALSGWVRLVRPLPLPYSRTITSSSTSSGP